MAPDSSNMAQASSKLAQDRIKVSPETADTLMTRCVRFLRIGLSVFVFRDFKNVYQRLFREAYRLNENCACNYYVFSVQLTAANTCLAHQTHHDLRAFFVPLFINKRLMAPTLTSRTAASPFPHGAGSH